MVICMACVVALDALDITHLYPAIGITLPMSLGDLISIYMLML